MGAKAVKPVLAAAVLLSTLGGCATERVVYGKPGIEPAEAQRDENECLRAAVDSGRDSAHALTVVGFDRDVYGHCMESRGYTLEK